MTAQAEIGQALREGAIKIKLENRVFPEIRSAFNNLARAFRVSVAKTGMPPARVILDGFRSDWQALLRRHYQRVQKMFSGMVAQEQVAISKQAEEPVDEIDLQKALLFWIGLSSKKSAQIIMATNEKNMQESLIEAQQDLQRQGKPTDNRSMAALAVILLKRKFAGRVSTIAMFETQQAAENSKFSEAEVMSGVKPSDEAGPPSVPVPVAKVWRTMMDERVRPAHKIAEGQVKNIHDPFIVDGQRLRYPGDTSLGATINNVIKCRCASIYRVSEPKLNVR